MDLVLILELHFCHTGCELGTWIKASGMVQNSFCYKLQFTCLPHTHPGPPTVGLGPDEKFFLPPSTHGPVSNLYAELERLTLTHTVPLAWSEKVNMCNRQIMTLPRNTKTYVTVGPGPLPDRRSLYRLPLPSWRHCIYPTALPTKWVIKSVIKHNTMTAQLKHSKLTKY